jgi:hypothetical protein
MGSRRGLSATQQQHRERAAQALALDLALSAFIGGIGGRGYHLRAISMIEHAYRVNTGVLDERARKALEADLREVVAANGIGELAMIAAKEESEYGFAESAVTVLTEHFLQPRPVKMEQRRNLQTRAAFVVKKCFTRALDVPEERNYQRLQELVDALGAMLVGVREGVDGNVLCLAATEALERATDEDISTTFSSWVQAFECRVDAGSITEAERDRLQAVVDTHTEDGEVADSLVGLAMLLESF